MYKFRTTNEIQANKVLWVAVNGADVEKSTENKALKHASNCERRLQESAMLFKSLMLAGTSGRRLQEIADDDCCCQEVYGSTFGRYVVKDYISLYM